MKNVNTNNGVQELVLGGEERMENMILDAEAIKMLKEAGIKIYSKEDIRAAKRRAAKIAKEDREAAERRAAKIAQEDKEAAERREKLELKEIKAMILAKHRIKSLKRTVATAKAQLAELDLKAENTAEKNAIYSLRIKLDELGIDHSGVTCFMELHSMIMIARAERAERNRLKRVYNNNKRRLSEYKREEKSGKSIVAVPRVSLDISEKNNEIISETTVQSVNGSPLLTVAGVLPQLFAKNKDACINVIGVSLSDDLCSLSGEEVNNNRLDFIMHCMQTGNFAICYKKNGRMKTVLGREAISEELFKARKNGQKVYTYSALGYTPSGLAGKSFILGAVAINEKSCDNRFDILNEASQGLVDIILRNYSEDQLNGVKITQRMTLSAAPQEMSNQVLLNYIVYENFCINKTSANGTTVIDGEQVQDSKDGTTFILGDFHHIDQVRGGNGLKASGQFVTHEILAGIEKGLEEMGTPVHKYCVNGKEMSVEEFRQLPDDEKDKFRSNLDFLTDCNANKIVDELKEIKLTKMKVAKDSKSRMAHVVVIGCNAKSQEATAEMLTEMYAETFENVFGKLGIDIAIKTKGTNLKLTSVAINKAIRPNNSDMTSQYIADSDRSSVLKLMPQLLAGGLNNTIKGLSNTLNELAFDCNAIYSVIQADPCAMFGFRALKNGEMRNPDMADGQKTIGARHPISTTKSYSTFVNLSLKEILTRIDNSNMTDTQKKVCRYIYINQVGYSMLAASKTHQEKHDGYDFDIDAFAFYLDERVYNILSKIEDVSIIIDRNEDTFDTTLTGAEAMVSKMYGRKYVEMLKPNKKFKMPKDMEWLKELKDEADKPVADLDDFLAEENEAEAEEKRKRDIETLEAVTAMVDKRLDENPAVKNVIFTIIANVFKDYLESSVASIGQVATGGYNNEELLRILEDESVEISIKNQIVGLFNLAFEHNKIKGISFQTPIKRKKVGNKTIINIDKPTAIEVIVRYASSKGTLKDTILYLKDCCDIGRYPAETAIDAVKNGFQVADLFNHTWIARALGSNKNMKVVQIYGPANDAKFAEIASSKRALDFLKADFVPRNIFRIKLLGLDIKGVEVDHLSSTLTDGYKIAAELQTKVACFNGSLSRLKKKLVEFSNMVLVIIASKLEVEAMSEEAVKLRESIRLDNVKSGNKINALIKSLNTINASCMRFNDSIKAMKEIAKEDEAYEDVVIGLEDDVLTGAKNLISFVRTKKVKGEYVEDYTAYDIGSAFVNMCVNSMATFDKDRKCKKELLPRPINKTLLNVIESEICEYLSESGLMYDKNIVGSNFEKINYIKNLDGEFVDPVDYIGMEVAEGYTEDDCAITTYGETAKNGFIHEYNGLYYVRYERETVKMNASRGIFVACEKAHDSLFTGYTESAKAKIEAKMEDLFDKNELDNLAGGYKLIKFTKSVVTDRVVNNKNVSDIRNIENWYLATTTKNGKFIPVIELPYLSNNAKELIERAIDGKVTEDDFLINRHIRKYNDSENNEVIEDHTGYLTITGEGMVAELTKVQDAINKIEAEKTVSTEDASIETADYEVDYAEDYDYTEDYAGEIPEIL